MKLKKLFYYTLIAPVLISTIFVANSYAKSYNTAEVQQSRLQLAEDARYALPEQRLLAIRECGLGKLYFCQRALVENLEDPDIEIRKKSAYSLGLLGQELSIEPLQELLKKEEEELKKVEQYREEGTIAQKEEFVARRAIIYETLWAVGFIPSDKSGPLLLSYLDWQEDYYIPVRRAAASALDTLGDPQTKDGIIPKLDNEKSEIVRIYLLRTLLQFEPTNSDYKTRVIELLKSDEQWVRYNAATAISDHVIKEAYKPLENAMLLEEDAGVRRALHSAYMKLIYN